MKVGGQNCRYIAKKLHGAYVGGVRHTKLDTPDQARAYRLISS